MTPDEWYMESLQKKILEGASEYVSNKLKEHGVSRFKISLTISTDCGTSATHNLVAENDDLTCNELPSDLGQQGVLALFSLPEGEGIEL